MTKNSKPIIGYGLAFGAAVTLYALSYVGIKLSCEALIKDKVIADRNLASSLNEKLNLTAQYQYLNSEERIVQIARDEMGMVKCTSAPFSLSVDREKAERIQKEINSKYE
jgi:hypothetical protein